VPRESRSHIPPPPAPIDGSFVTHVRQSRSYVAHVRQSRPLVAHMRRSILPPTVTSAAGIAITYTTTTFHDRGSGGPQMIDSGLWEGFRESRRCSRDTYPESYITEYILIYEDKIPASPSQPFSPSLSRTDAPPQDPWSRALVEVPFLNAA